MKRRNCNIPVAKTKALISFAVTAKLICTFVFARTFLFSYAVAQILSKACCGTYCQQGLRIFLQFIKFCLQEFRSFASAWAWKHLKRQLLKLVWMLMLEHMNRVARKLEFCLCENKGEDQLCSNCTADQRLCFRYTASTITFLLKPEMVSFWSSSETVQAGLCRTWCGVVNLMFHQ